MIEKKWRDPSTELQDFSPVPFWFLNDDLDEEKLEWALKEFKEKHIYTVVLHPRSGLEVEYVSDEFWKKWEFIIEKAKEMGIKVILYDEYNWPSGPVGGKLLRDRPDLRQVGMDYEQYSIKEGKTLEHELDGKLIIAVGIEKEHENIKKLDVTESEGKIQWTATEGNWDVFIFEELTVMDKFFCTSCASWAQNEKGYLDLSNPDAVKEFMKRTHEEYEKRFGGDFGSTIIGMFTDETSNYSAHMWTPNFLQKFEELKGYDLGIKLPELVLKMGDYVKTRHDYYEVISKLYEESFYGQIGEWAERAKISFTGHILEEENLVQLPIKHADLFAPYRHMQLPGIDYLTDRNGYELLPETSAIARFPNFTAKFITSISHAFGRKRTLVEIFGGCGWQTTLERLKTSIDWIEACGVNLINWHGTHQSLKGFRKRDFAPSHFVQEPWWEHYADLSDYTARLSYFNSEGKHVARYAVLFPRSTIWNEYRLHKKPKLYHGIIKKFVNIGEALLHSQCDFDYIFEQEILENLLTIKGNNLKLADEEYQVLILPPLTTLPIMIAQFIKEFYSKGGTIIACGMLPTNSTTQENDPGIKEAMEAIFGEIDNIDPKSSNGRAIFIPNSKIKSYKKLVKHLPKLIRDKGLPKDLQIKGKKTTDFIYQLREMNGDLFYLISNLRSQKHDVELGLQEGKLLEVWDPETGEVFNHGEIEKRNDQSWISHEFQPFETKIFRLPSEKNPNLPDFKKLFSKRAKLKPIILDKMWEVQSPGENVLAFRKWKLKILERTFKPPEKPKKMPKFMKLIPFRTRLIFVILIPFLRLMSLLGSKYTKTSVYGVFQLIEKYGKILLFLTGIDLDEFNATYELLEGIMMLLEKSRLQLLESFKPNDLIEISTKFSLKDEITDPVKLVFEDSGEELELKVNESAFTNPELMKQSEPAFLWDHSNRELDISKLTRKGTNKLTFKVRLPDFKAITPSTHGIEPVVLKGNFHVKGTSLKKIRSQLQVRDWRKMGFPDLSGELRYKQTINIPQEYLDHKLLLEFGDVRETVELWINGEFVGKSLWQPHVIEISEALKSGENQIELRVRNTLFNLFNKPRRSGIMGSVQIVPYLK